LKKVVIIIGLSLALIIAVVAMVGVSGFKKSMKVKSISYDKNLTVLEGGGGNSIVLTSEDGMQALVVDTKTGAASKDLAAAVKAKEITIVNTHLHRDHIGGNSLLPNATLIAGAYTQEQWKSLASGSRYPDKVIRPGEEIVLNIGGEVAHIRNMGAAHSWNDVIVYLENRKFLVTGDIVFRGMHPALFAKGGSNAASWVSVIDSLLVRYDAVKVLPGHGAMSDKQALADQKDYFISIQEAIGNPERIKAAEKKFKSYFSIPVLASFNKTVRFLENEKKGK
jgi:cyclase